MLSPIYSRTLRWVTLGSVALISASPVLAQPAPERIIIVGHYGRVSDKVQSLSEIVSYSDLDLSIPEDRAILRHRISLTARYLCDKLGESDDAVEPGQSCRDAAAQDAMRRVGTIEAHFAPRGTAWVHPPAWVAPYPPGWMTQYPDGN